MAKYEKNLSASNLNLKRFAGGNNASNINPKPASSIPKALDTDNMPLTRQTPPMFNT